jgi:glutamate synthase (NADPH/NADH) large chain
LNNCATGVATQNAKLRKDHFIGLPDMVINYFKFVAEETRELMAQLGVKKLTDLIGRTDLLELIVGESSKQQKLKLDVLLSQGGIPADAPRFAQQDRNPSFDKGELAEKMVVDCLPAILARKKKSITYPIQNVNRSIGARLSGEIAKAHGNDGLPDDTLRIKLLGSAGQSFGVWNAKGLTLELEGDANDYVGKGMNGGRLVIYPPKVSSFEPHRNIIIGNTCLYGATGGELFASGMAGERFGVRNSGAFAIIEGAGDHCCEYMTGGIVIVLGPTGRNFAAGMSGGIAYVLDERGDFEKLCNMSMVELEPVPAEEDVNERVYHSRHDLETAGRVEILTDMTRYDAERLRYYIGQHAKLTGSTRAKSILDNWQSYCGKFRKVMPLEYRRALKEIQAAQALEAAE